MLIYHIHWGTSGNGGLYIDEIYEALKCAGFKQEVFVSRYYPFKYGKKVFFKYSDISHCKYKGLIRNILKAFDTIYALSYIIYRSRKEKPDLINYSLVSGCFNFVILFLKCIRWVSGSRIIITCHDVLPFSRSEREEKKEMRNRDYLFKWADYLLIHNDNSRKTLMDKFVINPKKIIYHRFPIQDLLKLHPLYNIEKKYDFLFIGHLRKEKGVALLLESWAHFYSNYKEARLCIAGMNISNISIKDEYRYSNIDFKLHYISDDDFCKLVCQSRYVVLPYLKGTNSGIVSDVLSLGASVIASDLPMFKDNPLLDDSNLFSAGSIDSLIKILNIKYKDTDNSNVRLKVDRYKEEFTKEVIDIYNKISDDNKK